ncbi:MAG: uroporphyrinogen-III C-methyltransferase [Rhodanobacteraceae bacterium]
MSDDTVTPTDGPEPATPRKPRAGLAAAAAIVAIIALILAAWSTWQLTRVQHADQAARQQAAAQLAELQSQLAAGDQQTKAGSHRLGALESNFDDLRSTVRGLGHRTTNLETALTNLNGQQQSGHDTLLLNDAEMLLRAGQQRFELFHDTQGALKAYTQAIAVLAQVQNPAFAPVRVSAITERDALAAAAPPARQSALDTLSALRGEAASLPLATPDAAPAKPVKPGFWSRIAHSFSGIVKVSHEDDHGAALPDTHFARQALALDLAQAQEAMLAFDQTAYRDALQRAAKVLAAQFDGNDGLVKTARSRISGLLAQPGQGPEPQLGGALAQLKSLRTSQTPPPAPASAVSSGSAKP